MWLLFILLSTVGWALVNVLDSLLVKHFEKNPFILMWSQSLFSIPVLLIFPFFVDIQSSWYVYLLFFGIFGFLGDIWFFRVLDRLDVSIANAAWPILSILLSIVGLFFFQESWTLTQTLGAVLIIFGALLLSFYHQHISLLRTLSLLVTLAVLYLPYYIFKKIAIDENQSPAAVFYWMLVSRELLAFSLPWIMQKGRNRISLLIRSVGLSYFLVGGSVIAFFLFAEYFGALAYVDGPLSLIAVVSNIQPFIVILVAAIVAVVFPSTPAKELFSKRSIALKFCSFTIVFVGLTLLGSASVSS